MANELIIIRNRRDEVKAEIAGYRAEIERLESELPELDVAERVMARLTGEARLEIGAEDAEPEARSATTKPDDVPTVPEMIITLLQEAKAAGKRGLEPKDMLALIAERWWPDVKSESVGPTAWRMNKRGDISKSGSLYFLIERDPGLSADAHEPETNEGTDALTSEPSKVPVPRPVIALFGDD